MRPGIIVSFVAGASLVFIEHASGWPWVALFVGFVIGTVQAGIARVLDEARA